MSLSIKILFILIITSGLYSAFSQNCRASVFIKTDLEDAKLYIDDDFIAKGDSFKVDLQVGEYSIYIVENLWSWNSRCAKDTIAILDCSDVQLSYFFETRLVDTQPQDAGIYSKDSLIGFTPLLLEQGKGEYLIRKNDYLDKTIDFQEISLGEKPQLQFIGQEKGESFYESTLFKVLVGTAVALGATTAYYKLEADKKFDEYQLTGNPDLLDQTDRYDIVSGVTFVALQINFGLILYLFLAD